MQLFEITVSPATPPKPTRLPALKPLLVERTNATVNNGSYGAVVERVEAALALLPRTKPLLRKIVAVSKPAAVLARVVVKVVRGNTLTAILVGAMRADGKRVVRSVKRF